MDFGARIYDSRIGRWFAIDNAFKEYPSLSPYVFVGVNPISNRELDGNIFMNWRFWETQARTQARKFAHDADGWFSKELNGKEGNWVVLNDQGDVYRNMKGKYAIAMGIYGSELTLQEEENLQVFEFKDGFDYVHYWSKPKVMLAQGPALLALEGAEAVVVGLEAEIIIRPLTGSTHIDIDKLVSEKLGIEHEIVYSKKTGKQLLDDLPTTAEGLQNLKNEIKDRTTANNGKVTADDKKLQEKIKTQEKAIGDRNKQKRSN